MKITRSQLRRIITEATKLMEYGESGSWGSSMNDYEQGYKAGQLEGEFADQRAQNDYDDTIMDVGYYYD